MIVVAFAIAVVVNLVANELPSTVTAIDATSTKLYSITDTTKDYLKTLDQDVNIYVLAAEKMRTVRFQRHYSDMRICPVM